MSILLYLFLQYILYKEEGEHCLSFLTSSLKYVNKDYAGIVAETLYNSDKEKRKLFLNIFEKETKELEEIETNGLMIFDDFNQLLDCFFLKKIHDCSTNEK